ncbi:uncharacterized protein LOC114828539 [Galendromus occidentalis]|uniref:Uncharacterized protein LOC114828539 n=1 Tax=Galendromus occidentalis TaxID=34638 RepID=A0AAJ7SHJ1_9ACAR|nr:uncharacterized protein LOC114828539 [Galendromus occidentalis]
MLERLVLVATICGFFSVPSSCNAQATYNTTQLERWTSIVIQRCSDRLARVFEGFGPTILERLQENYEFQMTHLPDMDPELALMARSMTLFEFWLLAYGQLTVQSRVHSELACHSVLCGEEWRSNPVYVTVDDGVPCMMSGRSGNCENGVCTSDRSAFL